jgi:hypothetical protein
VILARDRDLLGPLTSGRTLSLLGWTVKRPV